MTALFITFEGLDGSGKSTHLERSAEWLREQGHAVEVTKEPGGTRLGRHLREAILDPEEGAVDGRVELLVMFADRRHHLRELVEPARAAGRHVLCDRFSDSTRAYQGYGRGVPMELIDRVDALATDRRRPDGTLLFDLSPEQAQRRSQSAKRRRSGRVDRIDAEDLAFYGRVRDGYLALARDEADRFRVIDASGSKEKTWAQVVGHLEDLFGEGASEGSGS